MQGPRPTALTITRDELFRRLWDTPIRKLAAEFGTTRDQLTKICRDLQIPVPPANHWVRQRSGQAGITYRLPPPRPETPHEVTIVPKARAKPALTPPLLEVPDELRRPHPVIERWLSEHQELKRRDRLEKSPYHIPARDWTPSDHREHRILNTIFRAVEGQGLMPISDRRGVFHFQYEGVTIRCRLQTKRRRTRGTKPAGEAPTMEPLVFAIDEYFDGDHDLQRQWMDTPANKLEEAVPDIVKTLLLAGPALIDMRRAREEQELLQAQANRAIERDKAKQRKAENQWRVLVTCADNFDTAARVMKFLEVLEIAATDPSQRIGDQALAEWMTWAKTRAKEFDLIVRDPVKVFEEIAKVTERTYREER